MSAYVYRVTAQMVRLADGSTAHVAKFAYKPYWGFDADEKNQRAARRSGVFASERMVLKSDKIAILGESFDGKFDGVVYSNPTGLKTFYDDLTPGTEKMPKIGNLKLPAGGKIGIYHVVAERSAL